MDLVLGERIAFTGGSYELRGVVDGRYVVRIRYRDRNKQAYAVWTSEEREQFDQEQAARRLREDQKRDREDRNRQIYERNLAGESCASLARACGLSAATVRGVCARQERRERSPDRPDEPPPFSDCRDRLSISSGEWEQAKPNIAEDA